MTKTTNELERLLAELDSVAGLSSFKDTVHKIVKREQYLEWAKESGIADRSDWDMRHMAFIGNPGTGKTMSARMLGKILKELGILETGAVVECFGSEMLGQYVGQSAIKTQGIIDSAIGGILVIEEIGTLLHSAFGAEALDVILQAMETHREDLVVIITGFGSEVNYFLDKCQGIRSRIHTVVEFEDYTPEEMVTIFRDFATRNEFFFGEDTEDVLTKLMQEASLQPDFGNARGARNLFEEVYNALRKRLVRMQAEGIEITANDSVILRREDFESVLDIYATGPQALEENDIDAILEESDSIPGFASAKEAVHKLVDRVMYREYMNELGQGNAKGLGSLHMLFKGNAGTEKATIARIIGRLYKQLGVLRSGHVIECTKQDLVACYVGQTAMKTQAVIDSAIGGILFVDDADALVSSEKYDYGTEALTTIIRAMEYNRDDLMIIFAGTSEGIEELLATNQGLESRLSKQNEIIFEE